MTTSWDRTVLDPPLRMTRELVKQDRNSIDGAGALGEVGLDLFWCGSVVDVSHKDAPCIHILTVFSCLRRF